MTEATQERDGLLARIRRGDADAVRGCLDRYAPLVWSLARRAGIDAVTIEDVVQEVFIDVWKSAERYDERQSSEATFIATIARRRIIDRQRRRGARPEHEEVPEVEPGEHDESLAHVELGDEARVARRALAKLKPDQRRVILLSVIDGLSHPEIAERTGLPLGTVKSHIRRGLLETAQLLRSARGGKR